MRRILEAYCVQLGRIVSIDEAHHTLPATDLDSYDFECAESACRDRHVRIIGVNYRDTKTARFVEQHFRRWDPHDPRCPYFLEEMPAGKGEGANCASSRRHAALEVGRLAIFDPRIERVRADLNRSESIHSAPTSKVRRHRKEEGDGESDRPVAARAHRSASLARLVDAYRAAQAELTPAEFERQEIQIVGRGVIPLRAYLLPVTAARPTTRERVIYGGVHFVRDYGRAFKLRFIDRLADKRFFLYVTAAAAAASLSARMETALARLRAGHYCTAYALGDPAYAEQADSFSITIEHPSQWVLRTPADRPRAPRAPENTNHG